MADTRKATRTRHDMPALQMRAEFQPATMDVDKRTVQVTWTTGAPVLRSPWFDDPYYETLSLDPNHVRMSRLQSGAAPLLNAHRSYDIDDMLGVVDSAQLDPNGRSGSAVVRFARTPEGDKAMSMVADRVLRNVSVGYRTYRMEKVEGGETTIDTYRAVDWEPYELSMVPIGADAGAATRAEGATNPCEFTQERAMDPDKATTTTNPAPVPAPAPVAALTDEQRKAAATVERERVIGIQRAARALGRPADEVDKAIADGTTLDAYRALAIDARAEAGPEHGGPIGIDKRDPRIEVRGSNGEKWARAIEASIIQRCGSQASSTLRAYAEKTGEKIDLDPGEYRGARILDVARMCLDKNGISYRGRTALETLGLALSSERSADSDSFFTNRSPSQTTGDFPLILENVLHKLLLAQYGITPDTWRTMCTVGSAVDFRPNPRYRLGSFSALDSLNEDGEFKNKALGDAEKQTITIATKGNILAISRQALLNDDMSAFSRVAMMFGRAAAFSIETDFYALLALNSGLGPTMTDTHPLFDAAHSNVGTGAALGSTAIDADRVIMKSQKDPSGNEILDIRPAVLLVPASLGGNARQINTGQYDFDALTKAGAARSTYAIPNSVGGLFRDIVDTARLSGTRRYLFADPAIYPVIEVVFLDGQQQPYMEMRQGWRIDGIEWKIRLDYAVGAIDFRGAVTNAGV
jgi:hypothetical protein